MELSGKIRIVHSGSVIELSISDAKKLRDLLVDMFPLSGYVRYPYITWTYPAFTTNDYTFTLTTCNTDDITTINI